MDSSCSSKHQQPSATHFRLSSPPPPSKVQVLYGGTDLFDYEVRRTFNNDMLLAFISSSCIAALVYILTSCSGRPPQKVQQEPAPPLPSCSCSTKACLLQNARNHLKSAMSELVGRGVQRSPSNPRQVD